MDRNKIGMVDFNKFNNILRAQAPGDIKYGTKIITDDTFDWQDKIIKKIKEWVLKIKISAQEAFKLFDKNFDGLIC